MQQQCGVPVLLNRIATTHSRKRILWLTILPRNTGLRILRLRQFPIPSKSGELGGQSFQVHINR